MQLLSVFVRGARQNAWANYRLHAACTALSDSEFCARRVSFFPSLEATLNHILIVDWYYLDALTGAGRGRACFADEHPFDRLPPLRDAQRQSDRALIRFVEGLRVEQLDDIVSLERRDHIQRERVGDVLLHLYQHQIHHRGQAHAMLAGTGQTPPQLDEFYLAEELPLRHAELAELDLPLE